MLLEIIRVTKNFGGLAAVEDVSLKIDKKGIIGLIGPNGAGKTTLFNIVTGVFKPDKGKIIFNGEDITGLKSFEISRKGICRTFQLSRPFGNMTVLENVMVGGFCKIRNTKKAMERSIAVLDFMGMLDRKDKLAKGLILAERKRLEVAKALATDPQLLLLDEVMSGLNLDEINEFLSILEKIQNQGRALFIIEHVMSVIMEVCERIIVLNYGNKVAEGTPIEVSKDKKVIDAYLGEEYFIA